MSISRALLHQRSCRGNAKILRGYFAVFEKMMDKRGIGGIAEDRGDRQPFNGCLGAEAPSCKFETEVRIGNTALHPSCHAASKSQGYHTASAQ